jgi:hypothetical protein
VEVGIRTEDPPAQRFVTSEPIDESCCDATVAPSGPRKISPSSSAGNSARCRFITSTSIAGKSEDAYAGDRLVGLSIQWLPAHSPSRFFPHNLIEPEKTTGGTRGTNLWRTGRPMIRKASAKRLAVTARSGSYAVEHLDHLPETRNRASPGLTKIFRDAEESGPKITIGQSCSPLMQPAIARKSCDQPVG